MYAKEIMTTNVIIIPPDMPVKDIVRLLTEHHITTVPVVNNNGEVIGMVSKSDLTGRSKLQRLERSDWLLEMLIDDKASIKLDGTASDIMSSPVITVDEKANLAETLQLFIIYKIKRIPVLKDHKLCGMISRTDLLQPFAHLAKEISEKKASDHQGFLSRAFIAIDEHFHTGFHDQPEARPDQPKTDKPVLTVKDFQQLVTNFEHEKIIEKDEAHHKMIEQHQHQIDEIVNHHVKDEEWQCMLRTAQEAAEQGKSMAMILRFPNELCTDGGRAINIGEHGWQKTLRGEAAEIYLRWEETLKQQGFRLFARTLEYPGGFPGDIGFFLSWGN